MFQLGNSVGLTFLGWLFLRLLSLYFRLTETGRDSPMNLESTRDRYGFPGFRVGAMFETYHFGGSLEIDRPNKPKNYLGVTKSVTSSYYIESVVGKMLFTKLQHHFNESTVDHTFVIEGEKNDELPERALSTLRIVRINPIKVAKIHVRIFQYQYRILVMMTMRHASNVVLVIERYLLLIPRCMSLKMLSKMLFNFLSSP